MKKYLKYVAVIMAALFVLSPVLNVGAAATQATRDALREAQGRRDAAGQLVSEQANLLAGTEYEMSRITMEIQAMDQMIMEIFEDLEIIELDLLYTELRIEEAFAELEIVRHEMDMQTEILRERLRVMHEQGSVGLLEVLFQAESITDFFLRWEHIRAIAEFDQQLLDGMIETENRFAATYYDLRRAEALITNLRQQELVAKQAIEEKIEEQQVFFRLLHADAEREAEFLALLEEEARVIDQEFGVIRAQHDREVAAEQARIRAEQEARRQAEAAARQAEQAARMATLESFDSFAWPLPGFSNVSSPFGNRPDPFTGRTTFHSGIDLPAPAGTRINAAEAGYVRFAGWSASWGNYIIIDHADGYSTLYAHNIRNRVSTGQRVTRGQHIADVGSTGRSTGNHLHFEIRRNGTHVNPMSFFGG